VVPEEPLAPPPPASLPGDAVAEPPVGDVVTGASVSPGPSPSAGRAGSAPPEAEPSERPEPPEPPEPAEPDEPSERSERSEPVGSAGAGTDHPVAVQPDETAVGLDRGLERAVTRTSRRFRIPREVRITIMLIVLIFVVEYFLLPEIATARKNVGLLEQVNPFLLVLATGLEILSLLAYAQLTHTVLSPGAPSRFRLFRINMWSLSVSHVLPGGTAAGTAAGYRMLTDSKVPGSTAGFGMALQGVGSAVVLNVLFWVALVISIPLNGFKPLYGTAAIVGSLLMAAFTAAVLLLLKGQRRAVDQLHRLATHVPLVNADRVSALVEHVANRLELMLRDVHLLSRALMWAAANWLLDAASLWVFVAAFGHVVFPVDLLVAYGLANILAAIPITPGGLGVVEGVCAATLTGFGVPGRVAAVAVLTWRLVNFWLPIPAGGIAYLSLRLGSRRRHEDGTPPVEPGRRSAVT
jgi:uncharacterized protein (TIRG00374 family)